MPKIIGQQEQQRALKDILAMLKDVSAINNFLSMKNDAKKYTISFSDENNAKHSCLLFSVEKDDIDILALHSKEYLRKQIYTLAEDYRIALDAEEEHQLSDQMDPHPIQDTNAAKAELC